jgi:hypothetical protein
MANTFQIVSPLGLNLVMDVLGGVAAEGTAVDIFLQNKPLSNNQTWSFIPAASNPGYFYSEPIGRFRPGCHSREGDGRNAARNLAEGSRDHKQPALDGGTGTTFATTFFPYPKCAWRFCNRREGRKPRSGTLLQIYTNKNNGDPLNLNYE